VQLKFLIANCVFLGLNVATFFYNLFGHHLWFAAISAASVPASIWGIHSCLKWLRQYHHYLMHEIVMRENLVMQMNQERAANNPGDKAAKAN